MLPKNRQMLAFIYILKAWICISVQSTKVEAGEEHIRKWSKAVDGENWGNQTNVSA